MTVGSVVPLPDRGFVMLVAISAAAAGDHAFLDALDVQASARFSLFGDGDDGPGFDGGGEGESEYPAGDGYDFDADDDVDGVDAGGDDGYENVFDGSVDWF